MTTEDINKIKQFIADGKAKRAFSLAKELSNQLPSTIKNQIILLSGQFKNFDRELKMGNTNDRTGINSVTDSLLKTISNLEDNELSTINGAELNYKSEEELWEIALSASDDKLYLKYLNVFENGEYIYPAIRKIAEYKLSDSKAPTAKDQTKNHFAGRHKQLEKLTNSFNDSKKGNFKIVFISGETGSGKTKLSEKLVEQIIQSDSTLSPIRVFCDRFTGQENPYSPFKEILRQTLDDDISEITGRFVEDTRLNRFFPFAIEVLLEESQDLISSLLPDSFLNNLLDNYLPDSHPIMSLIREKQKLNPLSEEGIINSYIEYLKCLSSMQPLILLIDDIQWIDEYSLRLINTLTTKIDKFPILLIGLYAESITISDKDDNSKTLLNDVLNQIKSQFGDVCINLSALDADEKMNFLDELIDMEDNQLDQAFRQELLKFTGANPLFVTELLNYLKDEKVVVKNEKSIWENTKAVKWHELPAKIEAVLNERFEHLDEDLKEIISVASIQGNNFLPQIISRLIKKDEKQLLKMCTHDLQKRLNLIKEGKVIRKNRQILSFFSFSNSILQQFLYDNLSQSERIIYHNDVGEVLEEIYKDDLEDISYELAHHFVLSGDIQKSIDYLKMAGDQASKLCAYKSAAIYYQKALELFEEVPSNRDRLKKKLNIISALSICQKSILGWNTPQLVNLYKEATKLSKELGDVDETSTILFGWWVTSLVQLNLEEALKVANDFLSLGEENKNHIEILLKARIAASNTLLWMGKIKEALYHLEAFKKEYKDHPDNPYTIEFGQDPRTFSMMFTTICQWKSGDLTAARKTVSDLLEFAESLDHPYSLAIAYQGAAWLEFDTGNIELLEKYALQLVEISKKNEFAFYNSIGKLFYSASKVKKGETKEGRKLANEAYKIEMAMDNSVVMHGVYERIIAESYLIDKNYDTGLKEIEKAISFSQDTKEALYLPEMFQLKGNFLLAIKNKKAAIQAYNEGLKSHTRGINEANFAKLKLLNSLWQIEPSNRLKDELIRCLALLDQESSHPDYLVAKQYIN